MEPRSRKTTLAYNSCCTPCRNQSSTNRSHTDTEGRNHLSQRVNREKRNPAEAGFPLTSFLIQEWFFNAGLATGIQSPPCWQIHVFGDLRTTSTLINRWLESRYFSTSCYVALGAKLIPSAVRVRVCSLSLRLDANFSRNSASNLRLISTFTSRHLLE